MRLRPSRGATRLVGVGAVAGLILLVSVVPGSAQVGRTSTFTGTASARLFGLDIQISPTIGFDPLVDSGASVAQARLDSRGGSSGFAATPYPGSAVITLPGTVSVLTQGQVPADVVPEYPLYAASSHPTAPEKRLSAGVYQLDSTSTATESRSSATDGATSGRARVHVDPASGGVIARAETSVAAIEISPALTLHGVRSLAEVTQSPGGELNRTSSFEIAALEILGQRLAISDDGLDLLGQVVPIGPGLLDPLATLLGTLADQGTTIEVLPERALDDGIESAGLRITTVQHPPPDLVSGVETATVTITLGQAIAAVSNRSIPQAAAPSLPAGPASVATPAAGATLDLPASAGQVTAPPADVVTATAATASVPLDASIAQLFLVLAAGGVVLIGGARWFSLPARSS